MLVITRKVGETVLCGEVKSPEAVIQIDAIDKERVLLTVASNDRLELTVDQQRWRLHTQSWFVKHQIMKVFPQVPARLAQSTPMIFEMEIVDIKADRVRFGFSSDGLLDFRRGELV